MFLSETDWESLTERILDRNSKIVPAEVEIGMLKKWETKLERMIRCNSGAKTPDELSKKAKEYFADAAAKISAFQKPPPARGDRDLKVVTYLLDLVARIAYA